jgi:hypothetical protein
MDGFSSKTSQEARRREPHWVELITDPLVHLLAEHRPLCVSALLIVQLLPKLASSQNRTVIATIH